MKQLLLLASLAVVLAGATRLGLAEESAAQKEKEFAATCPVSGGPAAEENVVEYRGKKIYFCCDKCPQAFKKDPKKFQNNVYLQLLETGQLVQIGCPMSGGPTDEATAEEVGNAKVAFCCEKCQAKFAKTEDDKKLEVLFKNFDEGFTLQTECPVSGKAINPEASVEHNGKQVYFCCPNCPKAFTDNPEKFIAKLPQFQAEDEDGGK